MLHFSRWKSLAILASVLIALLFSAPNLFSPAMLNALPDWMPKKQISLGLDLQGGVHLQVKVEEEGLIEERMQTLHSDIRASLRDRDKGQIGYRNIASSGREVRVTLLKPEDREKVIERLKVLEEPVNAAGSLIGGLGVVEVVRESGSENVLIYSLSQEGIENRVRSAVSQSIEVIRRRVDELGTTEPIIQRQGDDRIIVQVPGFDDPERLKDVIGKTAKLSFRNVNETVNPQDVCDFSCCPSLIFLLRASFHGLLAGTLFLAEKGNACREAV